MPVQVLTDYKRLKYFMTVKKLTPRQIKWVEFLSEFNFAISYQSGKKNNKANALTQKLGDHPTGKKDEQLKHYMCEEIDSMVIEHCLIKIQAQRRKNAFSYAKI